MMRMRNIKKIKGISFVELMVALALAGMVISMVFMVYRFMFYKQTVTSDIIESVNDVVLAVNYIKSDLCSAVIDPQLIDSEPNGRQTSAKTLEEALDASFTPGANKFGFLTVDNDSVKRVEYEIDGKNFVRKTFDRNGSQTFQSVLSRGKIISASVSQQRHVFNSYMTLCITLVLKVQTKVIGKDGFETVTKEISFNIYPYVLNLNLKMVKFAGKGEDGR